MDDLTGIIERLIRADVDFVLVGGLAAVTHGTSMATQDIETIQHLEVIQRERGEGSAAVATAGTAP